MKDEPNFANFAIVIDCIFGFSFKGPEIREPYNKLLNKLKNSECTVISVDVPSGWQIDSDDN